MSELHTNAASHRTELEVAFLNDLAVAEMHKRRQLIFLLHSNNVNFFNETTGSHIHEYFTFLGDARREIYFQQDRFDEPSEVPGFLLEVD